MGPVASLAWRHDRPSTQSGGSRVPDYSEALRAPPAGTLRGRQ
jgi:hypothetical protein